MNNFSPVLPVIIGLALKTLREQALITRFINRDFENVPAGQGDVVNVTVASAATVADVAPSAAPVQGADSTPVKVPITLDQWKKSDMYITDKEVGMITSGIIPAQMAECIKALANYVNSYFYSLYWQSYGMVGTPGTIAFNAGTTADAIAARKLLNKQLAPFDPRVGILDVEAEAKALAVDAIVRADARGSGEALTTGFIAKTMGISWFMDQLVARHVSTPLSAGAATVNGAHAVNAGSTDNGRTGTVSIAKATNPSNLVKGDILTFAGDTQQYSVQADVTLAVGNTTVTIAPALKTAKAGAEAVTLAASHTVNPVFHRDALSYASRPLGTLQLGGASQGDFFSVADEQTGVVLRAELVRQNKQTLLQFDILFGGKMTRPELFVRLAGQ
jgi:hypothetical protein